MKYLTFGLLIVVSLTILSCEDDNETSPVTELAGVYEGTFEVTYFIDIGFGGEDISESVSVSFDGDRFDCTCRGSGTFAIENGNVNFNDENIWNADFDGKLIMSGSYSVQQENGQVVITDDSSPHGIYKYTLRKKENE
ncbi:MAG: hypothetical protein AAFQ94_19595 [Bacteroidota bacterium]